MPNLGTLRAQVRAIADVDATDVSDADINTYINDAYQEAIADEQWPFLLTRAVFNTVSGTADYDVTSVLESTAEAHRILHVSSEGIKLEKLETAHYLMLEPHGGSAGSGTPQAWTTMDGTKLVLWPAPGGIASVQVVYLKLAPDLTQDTNEPLFPSRYHHVLKWGALRFLYTKIGDLESAEGATKTYEDGVSVLVADLVKSTPPTALIWGKITDVDRPLFGRLKYPWE